MTQRDSPSGISALATAPVPSRGWTEAGLVVMVLIWGANFAVVKRALDAFDPLGFNALRFLLASLFVYAVLRARGPVRLPGRRDIPRVLLLGVLGNAVYQMTFIFGLDRTQAGNAGLMMALSPLFVAVLSAWLGHERPGGLAWMGAGLSVVGVGLVSGGSVRMEGATLTGDLVMVGAGLLWALYSVGAQPLVARYGPVPTTAWTLWSGGAVLVLVGIPSVARQEWAAVDAVAWGGLLFSAFLSIGLAYLIWYRGVERIGNTRTAIFSNAIPVVALGVGALWLGERVTAGSIAGAALIIGGVLLVRKNTASG